MVRLYGMGFLFVLDENRMAANKDRKDWGEWSWLVQCDFKVKTQGVFSENEKRN